VWTCLFTILIFVLVTFVPVQAHEGHSHEHSHSHSHSHSHDDDHSHTTTQTKQQTVPKEREQKAIPPSSKFEEVFPAAFKFVLSGVWSQAIFATALIGVAPILVLFVVPLISTDEKGNRVVNHPLLKTLLGFAVGGLLGDVFLHLLPHALVPHEDEGTHGHSHSHTEGHDHSSGVILGLFVLAGIVTFFIIEKIMRIRSAEGNSHSHSHSHSKKTDEATVVNTDESTTLRSRTQKKGES